MVLLLIFVGIVGLNAFYCIKIRNLRNKLSDVNEREERGSIIDDPNLRLLDTHRESDDESD